MGGPPNFKIPYWLTEEDYTDPKFTTLNELMSIEPPEFKMPEGESETITINYVPNARYHPLEVGDKVTYEGIECVITSMREDEETIHYTMRKV